MAYIATATLEDEQILTFSGTFAECIAWYESLAEAVVGQIDLDITQQEVTA